MITLSNLSKFSSRYKAPDVIERRNIRHGQRRARPGSCAAMVLIFGFAASALFILTSLTLAFLFR